MSGGRVCRLGSALAFRPRPVLPAGPAQFLSYVFIFLLASLQVQGELKRLRPALALCLL